MFTLGAEPKGRSCVLVRNIGLPGHTTFTTMTTREGSYNFDKVSFLEIRANPNNKVFINTKVSVFGNYIVSYS